MSVRFKTQSRILSAAKELLMRTYEKAARDMLPHQWVLDQIRLYIHEAPEFRKLPQYAQADVRGYEQALADVHRKLIVYVYVVDGKPLSIECPEYRAIPSQVIHERYSETGYHAYRGDWSRKYF